MDRCNLTGPWEQAGYCALMGAPWAKVSCPWHLLGTGWWWRVGSGLSAQESSPLPQPVPQGPWPAGVCTVSQAPQFRLLLEEWASL